MKFILLGLLIINLCSCNGIGQIQYGYGEPILLGSALNERGSGQPIDLHNISVKVGKNLFNGELTAFDIFVGGFVAIPEAHESGIGGGGLITPRILYNKFKIKPFVAIDLGIGFFDWDAQGSDLNFLVGGGPGLLLPINDRLAGTTSVLLFHLSNAGLDDRNPGLNSDVLTFGLEYKF